MTNFASAARVHVGGVEEVDAEVEGRPEVLAGGGLVEHPGPPGGIAVGHAAQGEARDLDPRTPQPRVLQGVPSVSSRNAPRSRTSSRQSEWPIG